ncbi:glycosyltransferase [uncultured Desulfobacter sp.]|uniref:glycosyltransferase n=1 Tax=uncultured Desulfobacter sp. TaxID=240139 RepID=UPI0029F4B1C0|nr:glycosyltransferase [uncultured Desulfobacter sp.]
MRILIVAIGSQGDVNPFIKIGLALQKRAHDVTILSNNYFRDSIQNAGLNFSPVGSIEDFNKMDQPDNASRLVTLGVGDKIRLKNYKSNVVAKKLERLITDKVLQTRCKQIADKLNNIDPLDDICKMIESTVK